MQQIIVSGIGGQGVLFATKLLAETALDMGRPVLVSETHGMAQRGGNVLSHLKVSSGSGSGDAPVSPLVRPGHADVLLALHPDALLAHGFFLKPGGRLVRDVPGPTTADSLDATGIAADLGTVVSANLVLLGFAAGLRVLFCGPEELGKTLKRLGGRRLETSLRAFAAGLGAVRLNEGA